MLAKAIFVICCIFLALPLIPITAHIIAAGQSAIPYWTERVKPHESNLITI